MPCTCLYFPTSVSDVRGGQISGLRTSHDSPPISRPNSVKISRGKVARVTVRACASRRGGGALGNNDCKRRGHIHQSTWMNQKGPCWDFYGYYSKVHEQKCSARRKELKRHVAEEWGILEPKAIQFARQVWHQHSI